MISKAAASRAAKAYQELQLVGAVTLVFPSRVEPSADLNPFPLQRAPILGSGVFRVEDGRRQANLSRRIYGSNLDTGRDEIITALLGQRPSSI